MIWNRPQGFWQVGRWHAKLFSSAAAQFVKSGQDIRWAGRRLPATMVTSRVGAASSLLEWVRQVRGAGRQCTKLSSSSAVQFVKFRQVQHSNKWQGRAAPACERGWSLAGKEKDLPRASPPGWTKAPASKAMQEASLGSVRLSDMGPKVNQ